MFISGEVNADHLLDTVVADAILKTVIIDTYNFDKKQEHIRWNERDLKVFQYMKNYLE